MPDLEADIAAAALIVVVGSEARGPFMPPYTKQVGPLLCCAVLLLLLLLCCVVLCGAVA